jgi:hypothetical protein
LADGSIIANFEVFENIKTGSGSDRLVQLGQIKNDFRAGAGDDTVNPGLGLYDYADGGDGDDLLILDFSVTDTGRGVSGYGSSNYANFQRQDSNNNLVDRLTANNFERFQITGTGYDDTLFGGEGMILCSQEMATTAWLAAREMILCSQEMATTSSTVMAATTTSTAARELIPFQKIFPIKPRRWYSTARSQLPRKLWQMAA